VAGGVVSAEIRRGDSFKVWPILLLLLLILGNSVIKPLGILMLDVRSSVVERVEPKLVGTGGMLEKNEAPLMGEFWEESEESLESVEDSEESDEIEQVDEALEALPLGPSWPRIEGSEDEAEDEDEAVDRDEEAEDEEAECAGEGVSILTRNGSSSVFVVGDKTSG